MSGILKRNQAGVVIPICLHVQRTPPFSLSSSPTFFFSLRLAHACMILSCVFVCFMNAVNADIGSLHQMLLTSYFAHLLSILHYSYVVICHSNNNEIKYSSSRIMSSSELKRTNIVYDSYLHFLFILHTNLASLCKRNFISCKIRYWSVHGSQHIFLFMN